ncbi:outer membrane beta-barrel protein [Flavobacterium sp.]|uniref:outer membrane beta-barrel protein n=1 Tax=Flavobacterium sp. TaxID=239 RepID=UPI002610AE9E|nr:outer membrane beta-barrel protein [Flavobacterium sp.]
MKNKITLIALLFLSFSAISQDKKFSIDVNYPLSLDSNDFQKITGVIDASFKYRFKETDVMKIGVSYTFDLLKDKIEFDTSSSDLDGNYTFHHLGVFGEFKLNSNEKLHPFVGIGYSMLSSENEFMYVDPMGGVETRKEKTNDSGLNLNFGVTYDISSQFFIQTYFHYIRIYKTSIVDEDEKSGVNYNQLKLGVGYRF